MTAAAAGSGVSIFPSSSAANTTRHTHNKLVATPVTQRSVQDIDHCLCVSCGCLCLLYVSVVVQYDCCLLCLHIEARITTGW
jgi:hypothetical protein